MYKFINLFSFILSFYITLKLIPLINSFGLKNNILDRPNSRKQHKEPVVRIGGLAMYIGFIITLIFLYILSYFFDFNLNNNIFHFNCFLFITISFFLIGLFDDFLDLSPLFRLIYQICTCSFVWFIGLRIENIYIPIFNNNFLNYEVPLLLSLCITVFWIVGITNSINWIDGLDGLASGVVLISLFTFFLISINIKNEVSLLLIPIALGTILGFLKYNTYPSKILMGDGGSHFLGSTLAFFSLLPLTSNNASLDTNFSINFFYPIFILAVPLFDMVYVIFSRIIEKHSPFYPDRKHIHHRLLNVGISHKNTVLIIYSIQFLFCFFSFTIFRNNYPITNFVN